MTAVLLKATSSLANYLQLCDRRTNQGRMNAAILGLKTISSALPPKKFKRKFLHSVMKYTTHGVSTFNSLILELQLFKAWDVNPNPGPTIFDNNKKDKTNKLEPDPHPLVFAHLTPDDHIFELANLLTTTVDTMQNSLI